MPSAHRPTRSTTWKVSCALTALRVRTTYSPSIDSSAIVKPLKIDSSTTSVVQPGDLGVGEEAADEVDAAEQEAQAGDDEADRAASRSGNDE